MVRATNFLIITGSIAMIFVIIILGMIIGLLVRIRSGFTKVEQVTNQLQSLTNLPFHFLERRLQGKDK